MSKRIIKKLLEKVKGDSFRIDVDITDEELFAIMAHKFFQYLRGKYKTIGIKGLKKRVFIGKKVIFRHKSRISLGKSVKIGNYSEIDGLSRNGITIGNGCSIGNYTIIRGTGSLEKLGIGITIGNNSSCADNCFFGCSGGVTIGNDVIMGQNVRFHSQSHNYMRTDLLIRKQGVASTGINIGNNIWIGSGVVILDGVTIGDNCVIGANALVNRDVSANSVAVGNPAKIIKKVGNV